MLHHFSHSPSTNCPATIFPRRISKSARRLRERPCSSVAGARFLLSLPLPMAKMRPLGKPLASSICLMERLRFLLNFNLLKTRTKFYYLTVFFSNFIASAKSESVFERKSNSFLEVLISGIKPLFSWLPK